MKNFLQIVLSITLILIISGCSLQNRINTQNISPEFDNSIAQMDASLIKTIPDMTSVAFEWGRHEDPSVAEYNLYRSNLQVDGDKLVKVATIKNRFVTHYVDTKLTPNTQYVYSMTVSRADGKESQPSQSVSTKTLPLFESVSYIVAISNMPNQIKILWRPHQSERVKEYLIERSDNNTSQWSQIKKN